MNKDHLAEADAMLRRVIAALQNIQDALATANHALAEADKRINWAFGEYINDQKHQGEGKPE